MRLVFLKQEGGLIQGIALVVVDEDGGVAGVILAMTIMVVEVGVEVVVATVEDGLITLAAVEADGAQVAVVALPGVVVVLVEDLMPLAGVEALEAMTATVVVEAAGDQLLVVLTVLVEEMEPGEQLLVALMTQDGVAPKRPSQHRKVEAAGGLAVVVAGDRCVLRCVQTTAR
jgi:hypothetical protein